MSKPFASLVSIAAVAAALLAQTSPTMKTGPAVGLTIPDFSARDQFGAMQTSKSILGTKGALLVFFRSADW